MIVKITSHTIVKNEEKFIKPALEAVLPYVEKALVWDTGSQDKTAEIIKSLNNPKIEFEQKGSVDALGLVKQRQQQIAETKTDWILLVDGDEIWPAANLEKLLKAAETANKKTVALVCKTRNCIGDIYHYLPERKGKYKIGDWQGHLNIRLARNLAGLAVKGMYPDEAYVYSGIALQDQPERLEFVDTWYLHTTHLQRTSFTNQFQVLGRSKKFKFWKFWEKGIRMDKSELPEVLTDYRVDPCNL